jgi:hypothetical protein
MGAEQTAGDGHVRRELARIARRMRLARVAAGASWWLATVGVACLALFLADNLLHLPAALRLIAALAALGFGAWELVVQVVKPALARSTPEAAARAIEAEAGRGDNLLINACCFEAAPLAEHERSFAAPVLQGARAVVRAVPLAALCRLRRLGLWAAAAGLVTGGWLLYHAESPERLDNAFARFALPLADVPPAGSVALTVDPSGDVSIAEGSDLQITVTARARIAPPPPTLVWQEGARSVAPESPAGETITLSADPARPGAWVARMPAVRRAFAFRVFCADSSTRSVRVDVAPLPRLTACSVAVTPPGYVGGAAQPQPGPPATLTALAGSKLSLSAGVDQAIAGLVWRFGGTEHACRRVGERWVAEAEAVEASPCELAVPNGPVLARGAIQIAPDAPPQVELGGVDANRLLLPGASLPLTVEASDDHGLRRIALVVREGESGDPHGLKEWRYLGPPGPPGAHERWTLELDPERFQPGRSYVLTAEALDWSPHAQPGKSRPVVLRIKALGDITASDPAAKDAVAALKEAIVLQREATGMSDNLAPDLAAAIAGNRLPGHRDAIAAKQGQAQLSGRRARDEFAKAKDERTAHTLTPLVDGEMDLVLKELAALPEDAAKAPTRLQALRERQRNLLEALIAALGEAVALEQSRREASAKPGPTDQAEHLGASSDAADKLADDLREFMREQSRIVERSRSLMDTKPLDLSDAQAQALGELAREEAKEAKYLEEKLTDFSKVPNQDFADAKIAEQLNEVWQDISKADEALYKQNVEVAVPLEQSGLELAKSLENNLERWLSAHRDNQQWKMEEAAQPADVPVAELPKELEDIVGDLLDKEEDMGKDVDDFSSAWMDNADKGVGWDVGDGPISDMSAKGITGNLLPNQNEVGGRSGEGRTGRSHGQMVEDHAEGKGGRETPSRLDPEPFESGSVKDSAKSDEGGPTGGGKVSGFAAEGLRGPVPPPLAQKMARLAGKQAQVRQEAGKLALELRRRHLPSGDLESAAQAMQALEHAAASGDGGAIRQRYADAMDALRGARESAGDAPAALRHERIDLGRRERDLTQGDGERVPPGYEEMASEYFRALAEEQK